MTGIAIDEVTTSADRPEYQARMVANAANEPGWFKYLNAYKFRQDRGGHGTKVSRPNMVHGPLIPFWIDHARSGTLIHLIRRKAASMPLMFNHLN